MRHKEKHSHAVGLNMSIKTLKNKIMRKINYLLSTCLVIFVITGLASCSNEESGDQSLNFKSDKEKVEEMMYTRPEHYR